MNKAAEQAVNKLFNNGNRIARKLEEFLANEDIIDAHFGLCIFLLEVNARLPEDCAVNVIDIITELQAVNEARTAHRKQN